MTVDRNGRNDKKGDTEMKIEKISALGKNGVRADVFSKFSY